MNAASSPAPRKRDAAATPARILAAAQRAFPETGYSHTGIREIAQMAGTSSTPVLRYFGSKAGLFEVALTEAMPVAAVLAHPREALGRGMAEALLDPANDIRPPLMITLAAGDRGSSSGRRTGSRGAEQRPPGRVAGQCEWAGAGTRYRHAGHELRQLPAPVAAPAHECSGTQSHRRLGRLAIEAIVDHETAPKKV